MSPTETLAAPRAARPSALTAMAVRLNADPTKLLQTLKSTVFKGASDDELNALCIVANEYGLNPFIKEIYAFPAKGGGITPIVSVDGWIRIMNDHPQMDGIEFEMHHKGDKLDACTCIIFRKDRGRPIKVTEYLSECRRPTEPWKMENRMLRHKAAIQCARYAFGFSGITDEDEAEDIQGGMRNVTGTARESDPYTEQPAEPVEVIDGPKAKRQTRARPTPTPEHRQPDPEPEPEPEPQAPAERGARAFYEKHTVTRSPQGAPKVWVKASVSLTIAGGPIKEASTFNHDMIAVLDSLEGGEEILVEFIENKDARYPDTLSYLAFPADESFPVDQHEPQQEAPLGF